MAAESEGPPHLNGTSGRSRGPKDAEAASDPVHRSTNESGVMERSIVKSQTLPMSQVPKLFPNPSTASATNSAVSSREPSPVRHSSRTYNPSSPTRVSSHSRKTSQDPSPTRYSNGLTSGPPTNSSTPNLQRSSSSPVRSLVLSVPNDSLANVPSPEKSNMPSWATNRRTDVDSTLPNTSQKRSSLPLEELAPKPDRNTPRTVTRGVSGQGSSLETVEEMASNPSTPSSETPTKPVIPEESRLHRIDEDPTPRAPHQPPGSGSDSGENRSSEPKEETRPQASGAARTPRTLMSQRSTTSLSAGARGKPADGSVRNMIVETETVSSIPQISMGVGNGERGGASRADQGTLRMKPSNETIRPRKEKKKTRRPNAITTGPVTSKADIFEARVANAVDEADVSDSDETFVYDSNPPDPYPSRPPRYHSRTPSATSMASQAEQLAGRTRGLGLREASHGVTGKRSMKFTNANPYNNSIDGDGVEIDMASRSSRTDGSGTITPRHHNFGRHSRNGMHPNLFDNDSTQSQSQSQKSPRHFIGNSYRHSRHSNTRSSPNYRTISGTKKGGEFHSYDYEAEGADDERTPLVGTPRTIHSRNGRRPNSASVRQMEYMAQRHRGFFARFGSCAIIFLMLLIVAGGATSFIVAATQPLLDVQVIAIQNVLASEQEIMLDLNVQAVNPNLFPVTIDDTDLNIFAKSRYVGSDKLWREHGDVDNFPRVEQSRRRWQLSQVVRCLGHVDCVQAPHATDGVDKGTDPPTDPEGDPRSMLLGRVFHFDSPLSFESSPWNHLTSSSKGQIRLARPGNKTEAGGTERWERVLQHPFELTVRGIIKYQLPLSSRYLSASVSSSIKVEPDTDDDDPEQTPPSNGTVRISVQRSAPSIRLPLDTRSTVPRSEGSRRPFTA
ncbi:Vacuolar segregation subunit 7 [Penicillium cf. griseofulvum]|uniref:Vacuolar segregation subunit 7 n=1 Tax=Penicillium cf. griseofulvum TaxID=2972120 RepID=A0A9W9MTK7_9EURO|nr:Vacuolar segregation subunit 7 [Penicillium cf. griseofulvum]KAJ5446036.1 Vacuolar segregation subunit 7 [Penicillium cf. griseofulvum]